MVALAMASARLEASRWFRSIAAAFGAGAALFVSACGHPATEAECQAIVERIVELELKAQKVTDPAEIAKRRGESLGTQGDSGKPAVLEGCVGRHITDRALACVRNADTASEITDRCLQ